ncbi:MAG: CotH kinase family protein, partial [Prolixibacteraceae bacterium]|nr:CotH kinase family protein [Prolixibacteraceae bacterium]
MIFYITNSNAQSLRIYEAQSENYITLLDGDDDTSDWFELINASEDTINLKDYGIGDDLNPDSAWKFPGFFMEPGRILLVFASGKNKSSDLSYWHSVVMPGDSLKYLIPTNEIPGWTSINYNDNYWNRGPSGFGYGDNDDATIILNTSSLFIRAEFYVDSLEDVLDAVFHMDYDDGFVAYLNGIEIARSLNLGSRYEVPAFNANTDYQHEAVMYLGNEPEAFPVLNFENILVEGKNVLAIQVHNMSSNSSDFTAIPFLSFLLDNQPENLRRPYFLPLPDDFHVNFKLDADNDSLFLFSPEGEIVDQLIFKSPGPDLSVGYPGHDFSELAVFTFPSPFIENVTQGVEYMELNDVSINTEPGLYAGSVQVNLSTTDPNDKIYFTTDGSLPTLNSGLYSSPVNLTGPTTLKARVIKEGFVPGVVSTASFYPNYDKTLPVTFISTNPSYLWDPQFGMYATGFNASEEFPYEGANFWMDWERPAHVEMYFPGMVEKFSVDCGIKIFGGWSRGHPQKSVSTFARKSYGDKNIKAKLFDDRDFDEFEALVYRNSGNDWFGGNWSAGTYYRDLVTTKMANKNGVDVMAGRPTIMYLNGQYWGIQNLREKINEHFIASNHNEDSEKLDILEGHFNIIEGNNENYLELLAFIENNDITIPENYEYIKKRMDINEFIVYNV